ncbi:hypothetical protein [Prevotella sp. 10(H)]|uniref:hypothetical protein n=1 Tax=Prevotella sp. 10(H) TaxID=1158294 RepID=UPI0004A77AFD|nr:hypothetical protein [Prevotella sp. 10(H)]
MKSRFKKALQGIFLTSVASIVSTNGAEASNYDLERVNLDENNSNTEVGGKNGKNDPLKTAENGH